MLNLTFSFTSICCNRSTEHTDTFIPLISLISSPTCKVPIKNESNYRLILAAYQSTLKVRRTYIYGLKLCSLALDVTPLTGKIIKKLLERGEKFAIKWYITLCILDQSIVRNRTSKLEFK